MNLQDITYTEGISNTRQGYNKLLKFMNRLLKFKIKCNNTEETTSKLN